MYIAGDFIKNCHLRYRSSSTLREKDKVLILFVDFLDYDLRYLPRKF